VSSRVVHWTAGSVRARDVGAQKKNKEKHALGT
jgi:hypothetical protein